MEGDKFQRTMFEALHRTFVGLANKVSATNFKSVAVDIFRENVVRGRGLLCQAMINTQQADPDLSPVFAAVVAIVNKEFPSVGMLLLKRLVGSWRRLYRRRNWNGVRNVNTFVGYLYCFSICGEDLVTEIMLAHLMNPKRSDEDVDLAIATLDVIFRVMMERNGREFRSNVLEPLRELLLLEGDDALSSRASAVVEGALQRVREWERVRLKTSAMPLDLVVVKEGEQVTHHLELDGAYDEEQHLNNFTPDTNYEDHEAEYDKARRAILGEDWEGELLATAEVADDVEENEDTSNVDTIQSQEDERKIKEQVYLIVRSSVRADEMAHKILRSVPRGFENTTSAMIVDSCCQEATYKKVYALLSERLCKTNAAFQMAVLTTLVTKYESAAALSEHQIDHIGALWAHLLRTDSIRWNCLSSLQILTHDASKRLMIQALLRNLEKTVGARVVTEHLGDRELHSCLSGLLPHDDDVSVLQLCVDLYEAMGVETFAAQMRRAYHVALEKRNRPPPVKRGRGEL